MKTKTSQKKTKPQTSTNYRPVTSNIYFDGSSYRVRATVEGTKYSKNFSSKKQALQYRKELLGL